MAIEVTVPGKCCCVIPPCTLMRGPTACGMARFSNVVVNGTSIPDFSVPVAYGSDEPVGASPFITGGGAADDRFYVGFPLFDGSSLDTSYYSSICVICTPADGPGAGAAYIGIGGQSATATTVGSTLQADFDGITLTSANYSVDDLDAPPSATMQCHVEVVKVSCPPSGCFCLGSAASWLVIVDPGLCFYAQPLAIGFGINVAASGTCPGGGGKFMLYWDGDAKVWRAAANDGVMGLWAGTFPGPIRDFGSTRTAIKAVLKCDGSFTADLWDTYFEYTGNPNPAPVFLGRLSVTLTDCSAPIEGTLTGGVCDGLPVTVTILPPPTAPWLLTGYCFEIFGITLTAPSGGATETSTVDGPYNGFALAQVGTSTLWTGSGSITFHPPFDNGHGASATYDVDATFDTSDNVLSVQMSDPLTSESVGVFSSLPTTTPPPAWIYPAVPPTTISGGALLAGYKISAGPSSIYRC